MHTTEKEYEFFQLEMCKVYVLAIQPFAPPHDYLELPPEDNYLSETCRHWKKEF